MTAFIIVAALMLLAAAAFVLWPLLRSAADGKRWPAIALSSAALPLLAVVLYLTLSNWVWDPAKRPSGVPPQIERMVEGLEARLKSAPDDVDGWLLLGRSYFELQRFFKSADAYQQAYTLTRGRNVDAIVGLGEALAFADENMLLGRSAELFEQAFVLQPQNPKGLWYSGLVAYQSGRRALARDRWSSLVALNPPEQVRQVLQTKIAEIERELSGAPPRSGAQATSATPADAKSAAAASAAQSTRQAGNAAASPGSPVVRVRVTLSTKLASNAPASAPLFVLVRAGEGGGPPIAVTRRISSELPLLIELSDRDAMIAGRSLAGAGPLTVVARIARSGGPSARSGDLEGKVSYDLASTRPVDLVIDTIVP